MGARAKAEREGFAVTLVEADMAEPLKRMWRGVAVGRGGER